MIKGCPIDDGRFEIEYMKTARSHKQSEQVMIPKVVGMSSRSNKNQQFQRPKPKPMTTFRCHNALCLIGSPDGE
jgi:hypothetical protein